MSKSKVIPIKHEQACGGCRHFLEDDEEPGSGFCYLNPPQLIGDDEGVASIRPFVHAEDMGCSHFKHRLNA